MILCSGCFDGFHAGHVAYLRQVAKVASDRGEPWAIAVASDDYVRKAKRRAPRWTYDERVSVLLSLRLSPEPQIVAHGKDGAAEAITVMRPSRFLKGSDWKDRMPEKDVAACRAVGAEISFTSVYGAHSSDRWTT